MSLAPLNTLRVTSQTTLDELKAFQEGIGKDDAKLRGTKNKDGSITLKAVDRDSSFLSKMFGVSKKRRDNARSALTMVMKNTGAMDRKPADSLTSLINADRKHSPKSAMLRDLVAFAKSETVDRDKPISDSPVKRDDHRERVMARQFTSLQSKGLDTTRLDQMVTLASRFAEHQPLKESRIKEFSEGITQEILEQLPDLQTLSKNERAMLGVSDIEGYVKAAVERAVPPPVAPHVAASLDKIGKGVAVQLANTLLGTSHVDDTSFKIGDEVFTKVETLGQGGFGKAELYRSTTTNREVVLKVPNGNTQDLTSEDIADAKFNFLAEIDMHSKIMDGANLRNRHVVSLEGAIRLPNGMFATVTEACTGGDMAKVMLKLKDAVKNGSLTEDQAMACMLTLMRDMVDGQSTIFNRGFSHRDVKFQNVFVDSKGNGKVADFGETAFGKNFSLSNEKIVVTTTYLAPENVVAANKLNDFRQDVILHEFAHTKAKVETYNALVGPNGILSHLGLPQYETDVYDFDPIKNPDENFSMWFGRANKERLGVVNALGELGANGRFITGLINDISQGEGKRLQDVVDGNKSLLPTTTLIKGGPADVFSFGSAILANFVKPRDAINSMGQTPSELAMVRYFNEGPVDMNDGLPPVPPPKPLEVGSFLTDSYVSPHQNGTVTGDQELDDLVNLTLQRDPDDRPTFTELLHHPIFQRPGVGDTSTREVIAALTGRPPKSVEDIQELAIEMAV